MFANGIMTNKAYPIILSIALALTSIFSLGQNNVTSRALINGSSYFDGAFLFFPLTSDSVKLDNPNLFILLKQNANKKLFYCVYNDEKSKIYDLDTDRLEDFGGNIGVFEKIVIK